MTQEYFIKIDGGIGRCIAATGAIIEFAKNNKTSIVTSFPYVFENLGLQRVYPINTPFLYEDKIANGIYLEPEPYNNYNYYRELKHISTVFNILLNNKDEFIKPKINLTNNEIVDAKVFIENLRKENGNKEVILVQPFSSSGGKVIGGKMVEDETYRSFGYGFYDKFITALDQHGYIPLLVKLPQQLGHPKSKFFNPAQPVRKMFALIPFVKGIVACDSFLHHASAALGTPVKTIALWGGTSPKNLGYEGQLNIFPTRKIELEPNRMPHNHSYYVDANKGSNNFDDGVVVDIINNFSKGLADVKNENNFQHIIKPIDEIKKCNIVEKPDSGVSQKIDEAFFCSVPLTSCAMSLNQENQTLMQ